MASHLGPRVGPPRYLCRCLLTYQPLVALQGHGDTVWNVPRPLEARVWNDFQAHLYTYVLFWTLLSCRPLLLLVALTYPDHLETGS